MAGYFLQVLLSFGKMKVSAVENMLHFKVYAGYLFTSVHKIQWVQFFPPFLTTVETKMLTAVRDIRPLGENISMSHQGELNEK